MENIEIDMFITKGQTYERKLKLFKDNVFSFLLHKLSDPISDRLAYWYLSKSITFELNECLNLSELIELIKNSNVIVSQLPIFKYVNGDTDMTLCFGDEDEKETYVGRGKQLHLNVDEIGKYLDKNYLVFIYSPINLEFEDRNKMKFRCIVIYEEV